MISLDKKSSALCSYKINSETNASLEEELFLWMPAALKSHLCPIGVSAMSKIHRGIDTSPALLQMHNLGWQQLATKQRGHISLFTSFARNSSDLGSPKDNCCCFYSANPTLLFS